VFQATNRKIKLTSNSQSQRSGNKNGKDQKSGLGFWTSTMTSGF